MVTSRRPDGGSLERSQPDYRFDFCGGHVVLDFVNTVSSRGGNPDEHFNTYGDLRAWAEERGVLAKSEVATLERAARRDRQAARRILARALELREALYRIFRRRASGKTTATADLDCVNLFIAATYRNARLAIANDHLVFDTQPPSESLDRPLSLVVRAAVDLLTGDDATAIGTCADETCGWLFLDKTRNRTRRWCDMNECGNRNKVRRFRERTH